MYYMPVLQKYKMNGILGYYYALQDYTGPGAT